MSVQVENLEHNIFPFFDMSYIYFSHINYSFYLFLRQAYYVLEQKRTLL